MNIQIPKRADNSIAQNLRYGLVPYHSLQFLLILLMALILGACREDDDSNALVQTQGSPVQEDEIQVNAEARRFAVFGPEIYKRGQGKPVVDSKSFSVTNTAAPYELLIRNGVGEDSKYHRVSSAIVILNEEAVVSPDSFNQNVETVQMTPVLNQQNEITVELRSKPGSALSLEVFGYDSDLPTIEAVISPAPNDAGWHNTDVTITFVCNDATSGVASCPESVTLANESPGQTITGSVVDGAGHSASTSVIVRIDKTAPTLVRTWPPVEVFGTDRATVEVKGQVSDNLSGIERATVNDEFGSAILPLSNFSVIRQLLTGFPAGQLNRDNDLYLQAYDVAGNQARVNFTVRHTLQATMVPTDQSRTEDYSGLTIATDRALVHFAPNVSRDTVHQRAHNSGGRIAGYLPTSRIALVMFSTSSVPVLLEKLTQLQAATEVVSAIPVIMMQPYIFDNTLLPANQSLAYNSINLSQAANYIIDHNLTTTTTTVAVIDSGLDTSYGQNEFGNNVTYIDLCTADGQLGKPTPVIDDTGHGTIVTSIIAGDNNGIGNNGIIRGIPGLNIGVRVFRTECSPTILGMDGAMVTMAMEIIRTGWIGNISLGDINVVSLAFGKDSHSYNRPWLEGLYKPHFLSERGRDILWVASAGNNDHQADCEGDQVYPAGMACLYHNVVAVSGYDPRDDTRAEQVNYGPYVTVYAPGEQVYTANAPGSYGFTSGASVATAMVTGAAALLHAVNPNTPSISKLILGGFTRELNDPDLAQGGLDVYQLVKTSSRPTTLHRDSFSGTSGGGSEIEEIRPLIERPGLAGFLFNYDDEDHHIHTVKTGFILANPGQPFPGALFLEYADKNDDDDYSWIVDRQELPRGTTFYSFDHCDDFYPFGYNYKLAEHGYRGVPVLLGFNIRSRSGDDTHLKKIKVHLRYNVFNGLTLDIPFEDQHGDPSKGCFSVTYALVPQDRVRNSGMSSGSSGGGSDSTTIDAVYPVIQGFELKYSDKDHHIDQLGVRLDQGRVRVWLNDKNNDDNFSWKVWWVDIE